MSALTPYSPTGSGYPGAGNTPGSPWFWENDGMRNDSTNVTLDHAIVYGSLYLTGSNLTLTNSVILAGTGLEFSPVAAHGTSGTLTVTDCTLGWLPGLYPPSSDDTATVWDGTGNFVYNITRCDLSGAPQGLDPGGGSTILSNWIHHIVSTDFLDVQHTDGIFCEGGSNILIQYNYIDMTADITASTAAIFIQNVGGGTCSNITVDSNFLNGGGYTWENQSCVGSVTTNNVFGGVNSFGDATLVAPGTVGTWSNNVHPDGTVVPHP